MNAIREAIAVQQSHGLRPTIDGVVRFLKIHGVWRSEALLREAIRRGLREAAERQSSLLGHSWASTLDRACTGRSARR
ncbi:MAG: hypothetical protein H0V44_16970 [Planctomycetes bacterium]|nr:hypothetical protein [Planctomycetota bacterium]